jgi:hypothetical protein
MTQLLPSRSSQNASNHLKTDIESLGVSGRAHVSERIFEQLQGRFAFAERGNVELSGSASSSRTSFYP